MIVGAPSSVILTPQGRPAWIEAIENNWYEGSRWSPHRSWVWQPVQDAKRDLDRFTRLELIKHARYLYKNSPFVRGLIERLVNLTIGSGIYPVPASSNADYNERAKVVWKRFSKSPCVDSRATMKQYQRVKARGRFLDGGGFSLLTYALESGRDKIQGFEADQITSIGKQAGPNNIDGVITNKQGKAIAYQVRGVEQAYDAEFMVHHFTPLRDGQVREEPILASAINTARDVDDILSLEKQAVKDASSHKDIIETNSGEMDVRTMRLMRFGSQGAPTNANLPADGATRTDYYKVHFGAEPVLLKNGDKYTPYKPDRPGNAWQGFMAFLANTIVLSTGLPPSLLLPVEIGGTDIRRDLELAQRIIGDWQDDIASEFQRIYEYILEGEIEDGSLVGAPDDWSECRWHFPKSITVDRGRDASQDRDDVKSGLMSREEYHGRYGDDGSAYEIAVEAEVRRRRFRILGTPIDAPFQNVKEYVELLSLDVAMLRQRGLADDQPAEGQAA